MSAAPPTSDAPLGSEIPIIDFSPWTQTPPKGSSSSSSDVDVEAAKTAVSKQIFAAFSTIGFMVVTNHGIPGDQEEEGGTTKRGFCASKSFFELDKETKMKFQYLSAESNRGYISMGQEKLDSLLPDIKETFVSPLAKGKPPRCDPCRVAISPL
jgi:isopenicillin N synthase-like dioxygenase